MGFAGANCTIPHKVAVIPLLDTLTDAFASDPLWGGWAFPNRDVVKRKRRALFGLWLINDRALVVDVDQAGKQLRIRAPAACLLEQPHHRIAGPAALVLAVVVGALAAVPAAAQPEGTGSCDGLVVSDVSIDTRPPDLSGFTRRWRALDVLNDLHVTSKPGMIRRFMLLQLGDECAAIGQAVQPSDIVERCRIERQSVRLLVGNHLQTVLDGPQDLQQERWTGDVLGRRTARRVHSLCTDPSSEAALSSGYETEKLRIARRTYATATRRINGEVAAKFPLP